MLVSGLTKKCFSWIKFFFVFFSINYLFNGRNKKDSFRALSTPSLVRWLPSIVISVNSWRIGSFRRGIRNTLKRRHPKIHEVSVFDFICSEKKNIIWFENVFFFKKNRSFFPCFKHVFRSCFKRFFANPGLSTLKHQLKLKIQFSMKYRTK